jgi:general secretion pathway protein N
MTTLLGRALPQPAVRRKVSTVRWTVAGLLFGTVLAVVTWAPAQWLARAVQNMSQSQVRQEQPRGTVWNGTAQLALSGGSGSSDTVALPGFVTWRIRPAWGGLSVDLNASCCTPQPLKIAARAVGLSGLHVELSDHQSSWPTSLLVGLGTPWNTLQLQGQLAVRSQGLTLDMTRDTMALAGQMQVDAKQVSSRLSTLKPMGSYRVTLQGGDTPTVQLQTLEGSLELSGTGQWVGSRLRFDGVATAQADRIEALSNLLNIIGRRNGARSIIKVGSL